MKQDATMFAALTVLLAVAVVGCSQSPKLHQYWCPMHPEVVSTDPNAECPKCGRMKLVPKPAEQEPKRPVASQPPAKAAKYRCPMHPQVVSDRKGSCPICGMDLVPIGEHKLTEPGTVVITPELRQRMGLTLGTVEKRPLRRTLRVPARIVAQEKRLYHVNVKVDGWVEQLFVATTGQYVRKGEALLTIYSPSLMNAQAEHLSAPPDMRRIARRRLELLDMSDEEIARLEQTGQIHKTLTLYAPASGHVIERNIAAGHRLMAGEQVLVLADLSEVWAEADLFQADAKRVKLGDRLEVSVDDDMFVGTVSFISPVVDAATRRVKVRADVPNPALKLKPEMWGIAHLRMEWGERLAIPASAVLRSGERTYAFRDAGAGRLRPVEIKVGERADDWFELLDGLAAGERVVTSANFLVDSESQLKAALKAMAGPGAAAAGGEHAGHQR